MKENWEKALDIQRSARRTEIIDAATKLFLERDLPGVSMMDIAKKVGISRVTLYKYYDSIDEIAFEVQMNILSEIRQVSIEAAKTGENAIEKIRNVLMAQYGLYRKKTEYYMYIGLFDHYYRNKYPTKELEERYTQFNCGCPPMDKLFDEGIKEGLIRSDIDANELHNMVGNSFISLTERMASRGNILRLEQHINPDTQILLLIDTMVMFIKARNLDT